MRVDRGEPTVERGSHRRAALAGRRRVCRSASMAEAGRGRRALAWHFRALNCPRLGSFGAGRSTAVPIAIPLLCGLTVSTGGSRCTTWRTRFGKSPKRSRARSSSVTHSMTRRRLCGTGRPVDRPGAARTATTAALLGAGQGVRCTPRDRHVSWPGHRPPHDDRRITRGGSEPLLLSPRRTLSGFPAKVGLSHPCLPPTA